MSNRKRRRKSKPSNHNRITEIIKNSTNGTTQDHELEPAESDLNITEIGQSIELDEEEAHVLKQLYNDWQLSQRKLGMLEVDYIKKKQALIKEIDNKLEEYSNEAKTIISKYGGNFSEGSSEVWEFNPSTLTIERQS